MCSMQLIRELIQEICNTVQSTAHIYNCVLVQWFNMCWPFYITLIIKTTGSIFIHMTSYNDISQLRCRWLLIIATRHCNTSCRKTGIRCFDSYGNSNGHKACSVEICIAIKQTNVIKQLDWTFKQLIIYSSKITSSKVNWAKVHSLK